MISPVRKALLSATVLAMLPLGGRASFFQTRSAQFATLSKEVSYLVPATNTAEFETVLADTDHWVSQARTPFVVPRGAFEAWARFDLPAASARREIFLETSAWERVEFFIVRDGRLIDRQLTGTLVPAPERSVHIGMTSLFGHSGFAAAELLPGAHTTVFARLTTSQQYLPIYRLRFFLWDAKEVLRGERADRLFEGLYFGVVLVLVLYNLGLFVALRERSYLYYVLMEIGNALIWGVYYGLTTEYLWPGKPTWDYYGFFLVWGLALPPAIQFMRHYLDTARLVPRGDWCLRGLAIAGLVAAPLALVVTRVDVLLGSAILVFPAFVTFWVALVVAWLALRQRHPAAGHFIVAFVCSLIGAMIEGFAWGGWLPNNTLTTCSAQVGSAAMGIILSLGLGFRLRQTRHELAEQKLADAERQNAHERERRELFEQQSRELEVKVRERTAELAAAREKAEGLLANILPQAIIEELKAKGITEPRRHEEVSILFTDFSGFTEAVATIPAKRLVQELDEVFRAFDEIAASQGLEKIKTIGDAYMAAAGLPTPATDHAIRCVRAGLMLTRYIETRNQTSSIKWGLRVGVHSGAVVAGVVGKNKYAYDVWGDTVNLASRLESASERNRVNISAYTYDLVRNHFVCEYRSKLAAKGKGEIDMYFVHREKDSAGAS